jgi:hypothetical protein
MYRCGALSDPQAVLQDVVPTWAHRLMPLTGWLLQRWGARWIAAGLGCDCTVQVELRSGPREIQQVK